MSGWWFSASASSATRSTKAIATGKPSKRNSRSSAPSTSLQPSGTTTTEHPMDLEVVGDHDVELVLTGETLEASTAGRRCSHCGGVLAVDRVADAETGQLQRPVAGV